MGIASRCSVAVFLLATASVAVDVRTWEEAHDKRGIHRSSRMHSDASERFLEVPEGYPESRDFDIAKTAPAIDFGLVQGLEPEYLTGGAHGGWGDVTRGPDGCFYFAIGNHKGYDGGAAYVIRYDPASKRQSVVLNTRTLLGFGPKNVSIHMSPLGAVSRSPWILPSAKSPSPNPSNVRVFKTTLWRLLAGS